ncbi:P-loop containing nucleoside triphosphate hydrolase protein [Lentinula raphanica]|uniref:P-loop containing nucleoside triphosphate hydrolase protein n=1 Tax=Lentinula raphanica TaxID=153919 RepID=A0AA38UIP4_9AGAR|nr:P-loop containing nucleoside triphosphate hydrolase protein [Lentinula raphanica]
MARNSEDVFIAIMGGTGTGKTSFTNLIGGSAFIVGNGLESCTKHIQTHKFPFEGHNVTLIDVPGFDDTHESDADILKMIADFLASEYKSGRRLNGLIYLHRISDVRMGGASKRNLVMFEKLCGQDAFPNVAVVTTRWDQEEEAVGRARLEELKTKPHLYKPILDGGGAIFRHERTAESAASILSHLVAKSPKTLLIQHEMVEEHKPLSETAAGMELQQEILKQVERHQAEMEELLDELKRNRDTSELEDLEAECKALEAQAIRWQEEARKLSESTPSPPTAVEQGSTESPPPLIQTSFRTTVTPDISVLAANRNDSYIGRTGDYRVDERDDRYDRLDPNLERTRAKVEVAVKYLLGMISTVLYTADAIKRGVVAATGHHR